MCKYVHTYLRTRLTIYIEIIEIFAGNRKVLLKIDFLNIMNINRINNSNYVTNQSKLKKFPNFNLYFYYNFNQNCNVQPELGVNFYNKLYFIEIFISVNFSHAYFLI